jgi:hypothetical protein
MKKEETGPLAPATIISGVIIGVLATVIAAIVIGEGRFAPTPLPPNEPTLTYRPRPASTPQPLPPIEESIPTAVGIRNPSGNIPCTGEPIIVDDYSLSVDECTVHTNSYSQQEVKLTVRNIGNRPRTFRFLRSSVLLKDDVKTTYKPVVSKFKMANTAGTCVEADLNTIGQVEIEPGGEANIESNIGYWCNWPNTLPAFLGPMPPNAKKVFIEFNDFGPFTGFAIETVP